MTCGSDLADELWVAHRSLAADEEHRRRAGAVERREHGRRAVRVRAVVEAQQDTANAGQREGDPERPSGPREDGRDRR